jgi:acetoin utilization deacetylase AcuC-like enzyme
VTTAFVSHPDCARHDTGWGHPDHQGRMPALVRAVHLDMLVLHDSLLQLEGRHAAEAELLRAHGPAHLEWLRASAARAEEEGSPFEAAEGTVLSGASWDAARAAAGCALVGVDAVLEGRAANAFCLTRPPGAAAGAHTAAHGSLLNHLAVAALHLVEARGVARVGCLELGPHALTGTREILGGHPAIALDGVRAEGAAGTAVAGALGASLHALEGGESPAFLLVGLDLELFAAAPAELHGATLELRDWAERRCGGRLAVLLEGGGDSGGAAALVQHLRALAGIAPA